MSDGPEPSAAIVDLRARADKCRRFAREYATDVGRSLTELAAELDRKADRLRDAESLAALPEIRAAPRPE